MNKFLITFAFIFILFLFLFKLIYPKYNEKKIPGEMFILIKKYKLNMNKIVYDDLVIVLSFCNALIISSIFVVTGMIESWFLKVPVMFIMLIVLLLLMVKILGLIYKERKN